MIRSRIAPTPSGYLHAGNAVNFVLTWLLTRSQNGKLLLRIDDLDATRAEPRYLDDIFRTLEWLGLDWDEGPQTVEDHIQKHSQILRKDLYESCIKNLADSGLAFACGCSRKDLQSSKVHACNCRQKNMRLNTLDTALRIQTDKTAIIEFSDFTGPSYQVNLFDEMRDFVIRRRDGIAAYQVASLADDEHFNINQIVRGKDLLNSTAAQLYLAQTASFAGFAQTKFYHHTLLKDEQGNKLSKSAGSASIKAWKERNMKAEKFYMLLSNLLGGPETTSLEEMLAAVKIGLPLKL